MQLFCRTILAREAIIWGQYIFEKYLKYFLTLSPTIGNRINKVIQNLEMSLVDTRALCKKVHEQIKESFKL